MSEAARDRPLIPLQRCPYCHEDVARGVEVATYKDCHALHHRECFDEAAGCAACTQRERPPTPGKVGEFEVVEDEPPPAEAPAVRPRRPRPAPAPPPPRAGMHPLAKGL